jgi:altronate dehydratase
VTAPGALQAVVLHDDDDVAVLITPVMQNALVNVCQRGEVVSLHVAQPLPLGHKIALRDLPAGHHVRKYGEVIGALKQAVSAGEHVHVHNLKSLRAR